MHSNAVMCILMRTTIEIPEEQRQVLHAIAMKKGLRGFSRVVSEAVAFYIQNKKELKSERLKLLELKGSWNLSATDKIKKRLKEVRKNWEI